MYNTEYYRDDILKVELRAGTGGAGVAQTHHQQGGAVTGRVQPELLSKQRQLLSYWSLTRMKWSTACTRSWYFSASFLFIQFKTKLKVLGRNVWPFLFFFFIFLARGLCIICSSFLFIEATYPCLRIRYKELMGGKKWPELVLSGLRKPAYQYHDLGPRQSSTLSRARWISPLKRSLLDLSGRFPV